MKTIVWPSLALICAFPFLIASSTPVASGTLCDASQFPGGGLYFLPDAPQSEVSEEFRIRTDNLGGSNTPIRKRIPGTSIDEMFLEAIDVPKYHHSWKFAIVFEGGWKYLKGNNSAVFTRILTSSDIHDDGKLDFVSLERKDELVTGCPKEDPLTLSGPTVKNKFVELPDYLDFHLTGKSDKTLRQRFHFIYGAQCNKETHSFGSPMAVAHVFLGQGQEELEPLLVAGTRASLQRASQLLASSAIASIPNQAEDVLSEDARFLSTFSGMHVSLTHIPDAGADCVLIEAPVPTALGYTGFWQRFANPAKRSLRRARKWSPNESVIEILNLENDQQFSVRLNWK